MTEPLSLAHLELALARRAASRREPSGPIGRSIEYHPSLGSTNDRARDLAASGEPEGTVVVAGEQTRGRGRHRRSWHSPPRLGLYMSVILRPSIPPSRCPILGLLSAVATARALQDVAGARIGIKWPNDLVAEDPGDRPGSGASTRRKIAGILTEARTTMDSVRDLVVGIGVNVNHEPGDLPDHISAVATSLRALRGGPCDRASVAAEILTALDAWYTLWCREGDPPILSAYRQSCPDLHGRRVSVTDATGVWCGTTDGITLDGALRVVPEGGGEPSVIRYGDLTTVRGA